MPLACALFARDATSIAARLLGLRPAPAPPARTTRHVARHHAEHSPHPNGHSVF